MPHDFFNVPEPILNIDDYKSELIYSLHKSWKLAAKTLYESQLANEYQYNKKVRMKPFYLGALVMKHDATKKPGLSKKLMSYWVGPLRIIKLSPYTAHVVPTSNPHAKPEHVNLNRLKHYFLPSLKYSDFNSTESNLQPLEQENIIPEQTLVPHTATAPVVHTPTYSYNLRPRK